MLNSKFSPIPCAVCPQFVLDVLRGTTVCSLVVVFNESFRVSKKKEEESNHDVPKFSFMNTTRHRQGVMGIWHLAVYNNQFHYNLFTVRLCLVAVKRFPKNTYFPEMLIFGKGKCI